MSKNWRLFLVVLNLIGFIGTVIVNGLSSALPINNKTAGELSDQYPNLFVPAGLTFSVWGVIYILLAIFVIYGLIVAIKKDEQKSSFIRNIGILFFISCLANIGWIFAWHYEVVPLSLILMLILLVTLITIYLRLRTGKSDSPRREKYLVHLPFSVYLGWITIATIANVTALLVYINWNMFGLGEPFWAVAVIIVGIAITLSVLFIRKDIFYCLVVDWALLGILLKRLADLTPVLSVIVITIVGMVLISVGIITQTIRKKVY
ncbi:tryptophan-rich sensory protein [Chloroflexota bacterium]